MSRDATALAAVYMIRMNDIGTITQTIMYYADPTFPIEWNGSENPEFSGDCCLLHIFAPIVV